MRERIAHHRARRAEGWTTVETPLGLAEVIATGTRPILVDCLTLWLTNIVLAGRDVEAETAKLLAAAQASRAPIAFVSNEVGLGIVPDHALAREFRDRAGLAGPGGGRHRQPRRVHGCGATHGGER